MNTVCINYYIGKMLDCDKTFVIDLPSDYKYLTFFLQERQHIIIYRYKTRKLNANINILQHCYFVAFVVRCYKCQQCNDGSSRV